jgi:hypothetical protein
MQDDALVIDIELHRFLSVLFCLAVYSMGTLIMYEYFTPPIGVNRFVHIGLGIWCAWLTVGMFRWAGRLTYRFAHLLHGVRPIHLLIMVSGAFVLGVAVEIFEYWLWRSQSGLWQLIYVGDIGTDLIMDTVGGLFAWLGWVFFHLFGKRKPVLILAVCAGLVTSASLPAHAAPSEFADEPIILFQYRAEGIEGDTPDTRYYLGKMKPQQLKSGEQLLCMRELGPELIQFQLERNAIFPLLYDI